LRLHWQQTILLACCALLTACWNQAPTRSEKNGKTRRASGESAKSLSRAARLGPSSAQRSAAAEPGPQTSAYIKLDGVAGLYEFVGKKVSLVGLVSNTPWQHLMAPPATHPYSTYFDVERLQIVLYSKAPLKVSGALEVRGTVLKVSGRPKRSGSDATQTEYHLRLDGWRPAR